MNRVYLSLGSNLGDRVRNLNLAIKMISEQIGRIVCQSAFLSTEPWGFDSENMFVNAALCCTTSLSPTELLTETQQIERTLGRTAKSSNGEYHDRTIDIDILLFNRDVVNTPSLTIPHPLMIQRDFVMMPLREIILEEDLQFIQSFFSNQHYSHD